MITITINKLNQLILLLTIGKLVLLHKDTKWHRISNFLKYYPNAFVIMMTALLELMKYLLLHTYYTDAGITYIYLMILCYFIGYLMWR